MTWEMDFTDALQQRGPHVHNQGMVHFFQTIDHFPTFIPNANLHQIMMMIDLFVRARLEKSTRMRLNINAASDENYAKGKAACFATKLTEP